MICITMAKHKKTKRDNEAKRIIYIAAFMVLGIIVMYVAHAGLEMATIETILNNFDAFGLSWDQWSMIHNVTAILFLFGGALFGWWQGRYWWRVLYIEKKKIKRESFRLKN